MWHKQRMCVHSHLLALRLHLVEGALLLDEARLRFEHTLPQLRVHLLAQLRTADDRMLGALAQRRRITPHAITHASYRLQRRRTVLDLRREPVKRAALLLDALVSHELRLVQRARVVELLLKLPLARRRRRAM